jgi:hypothetical protein
VNIQETGGVGGNVDFISVTGQHGGRTFNTVNYGADYIVQHSGANHIGARGTLSVAFTIDYNNGDGTRDRLEVIAIQFTDDRGNRVTATAEFNVL